MKKIGVWLALAAMSGCGGSSTMGGAAKSPFTGLWTGKYGKLGNPRYDSVLARVSDDRTFTAGLDDKNNDGTTLAGTIDDSGVFKGSLYEGEALRAREGIVICPVSGKFERTTANTIHGDLMLEEANPVSMPMDLEFRGR